MAATPEMMAMVLTECQTEPDDHEALSWKVRSNRPPGAPEATLSPTSWVRLTTEKAITDSTCSHRSVAAEDRRLPAPPTCGAVTSFYLTLPATTPNRNRRLLILKPCDGATREPKGLFSPGAPALGEQVPRTPLSKNHPSYEDNGSH